MCVYLASENCLNFVQSKKHRSFEGFFYRTSNNRPRSFVAFGPGNSSFFILYLHTGVIIIRVVIPLLTVFFEKWSAVVPAVRRNDVHYWRIIWCATIFATAPSRANFGMPKIMPNFCTSSPAQNLMNYAKL